MQSILLKERVDKFVEDNKKLNSELLHELTLYIYATELVDSDVYFLAKKLDTNSLFTLISYADGEPIVLPSKIEFRNNYLVAICFYMKEVLDMEWHEIKDVLNLPEKDKDLISSISIGKKINKIKNKFANDVEKLLKQIKVTNLKDLIDSKEEIDERFDKK